jgi:hypothetical protein
VLPTKTKTKTVPTPDASLAAAARLARFVAAHAAGEPLPPDDTQWLVGGLCHYLTNAASGVRLDEALALTVPPGRAPWWRQRNLARRDAILRQVAASLPGRTHARAVQLRLLLRRYEATAWILDQRRKTPSVANQLLYEVFTLDGSPPTGIRRLTAILADVDCSEIDLSTANTCDDVRW